MGNVFASSLAQPPMPTAVPPPNIPNQPDVPKESESSDRNPGTVEELHRKCKEVFPVPFEGSKFVVNKLLNSRFQIMHSLNMSSVAPSGYRFHATYVGNHQISPSESSPVLIGDIDPSGNMNANIIHQFNKNLCSKLVAQVQDNKFAVIQLSTDYKGCDFTSSMTLANIDILNESGIGVLNYLQNISPSFALGAELMYQRGPQIPGGALAITSILGKYTRPNSVISGSINTSSLHLSYYQKGNENIQVGVEVETNLRLYESVCSIGYQLDLPKGNFVFKGMVDSNWNVSAVLEKKLLPLPFTLALSGMLNHTKGTGRCGIGLTIGG